jgi:hypothetical protein
MMYDTCTLIADADVGVGVSAAGLGIELGTWDLGSGCVFAFTEAQEY